MYKPDYSVRGRRLLGNLFKEMADVGKSNHFTLEPHLEEDTLVAVGSTFEEKVFLLTCHLQYKRSEPGGAVDPAGAEQNIVRIIESLHRLLSEIPGVYQIRMLDIPGLEIPCRNLFEAKELADTWKEYSAQVFYSDQLIYVAEIKEKECERHEG
jgi:hypothetical protein